MKKIYKDYLTALGVISEEDFIKIIELLPNVEIEFNKGLGYYEVSDNIDEVAADIINSFLDNWSYVYCEDVDIENKSLYLIDVDTLEDLEEIKNSLSKWTISNYDYLKEILEEELKEQEENEKKANKIELLKSLGQLVTIEELKELIKNYNCNANTK